MTVTLIIVAIALVVAVVIIVRLTNQRTELLRYKETHIYTEADRLWQRKDAVNRSQNAVSGKVWEGMAPYLPGFPYNPQDCRHVMPPLDFLVLDGLTAGGDITLRFLEVKTGRSALKANERRVKAAVEAKRVCYEVLRLPGSSVPLEAGEEEIADWTTE